MVMVMPRHVFSIVSLLRAALVPVAAAGLVPPARRIPAVEPTQLAYLHPVVGVRLSSSSLRIQNYPFNFSPRG